VLQTGAISRPRHGARGAPAPPRQRLPPGVMKSSGAEGRRRSGGARQRAPQAPRQETPESLVRGPGDAQNLPGERQGVRRALRHAWAACLDARGDRGIDPALRGRSLAPAPTQRPRRRSSSASRSRRCSRKALNHLPARGGRHARAASQSTSPQTDCGCRYRLRRAWPSKAPDPSASSTLLRGPPGRLAPKTPPPRARRLGGRHVARGGSRESDRHRQPPRLRVDLTRSGRRGGYIGSIAKTSTLASQFRPRARSQQS
jgi:hypothetical protein